MGKKGICLWIVAAATWAFLTGCHKTGPEEVKEAPTGPEQVNLTVWGAAEDEELLQQIFNGFQARYGGAGGLPYYLWGAK